MVRPLSLAQHTLYADLLEQGGDDLFDPDLPENGSLLVRGNRRGASAEHAYYQGYRPAAGGTGRGQRFARYLGRSDDPDVAARIRRFQQIKAVRAERATTVRALIGAGMPRPDRTTGRIIEALARAGLFPDHAVLIGDAAYQTYDGVLGVRLGKSQRTATSGRPAIEIVVPDRYRSTDVLASLRAVDPSFAPGPEAAILYSSATGTRVAVTSLDCADDATASLIGFLIANLVRAIVLHGPGVPVSVPTPERFASCALSHTSLRTQLRNAVHFDPAEANRLCEALVLAGRAHALEQALSDAQSIDPGKLAKDLVALVQGPAGGL